MKRLGPVLGLLVAGEAMAQRTEIWSEVRPGLRYMRREQQRPALVVHALRVDLRVAGVRVEATAEHDRWSTVSEQAHRRGATAAVNGGFWGPFGAPEGLAVGEGKRWSRAADDALWGFVAVGEDGRVWISPPEQVVDEAALTTSRLRAAVSGAPMLVRDGRPDTAAIEASPEPRRRHPRTIAGVSRDGRTLWLVVADGRQPSSRGLDLYEAADLLVELGAHDAINLDGGGSSALFVRPLGGIVNVPCGHWLEDLIETSAAPSSERARRRGREREVLNHLLVFAPEPPPSRLAARDPFEGMDAAPIPAPPQQPALRLGRWRERAPPLIAATTACLVAIAVLARLRRRRSSPDPTPPSATERGSVDGQGKIPRSA